MNPNATRERIKTIFYVCNERKTIIMNPYLLIMLWIWIWTWICGIKRTKARKEFDSFFPC